MRRGCSCRDVRGVIGGISLCSNTDLADIFDLVLAGSSVPQIQLQGSTKKLKQHLKADFGNTWVVSAFTELVADECILLVESVSLQGGFDAA
jgi:hypothetical protein